jgi:hypothetical protein
MIKRLWKWLFPAKKPIEFKPVAPPRDLPFVIPAGATEDEIQQEIVSYVFRTGEMVFGEKQADGSVIVHK